MAADEPNQSIGNLQRLSLALGASEDSVREALSAADDADENATSRRLLEGRLRSGAEAVIFYCSVGLSETKAVAVLSHHTFAAHDAIAESGCGVRYAVCYRPWQPDSTDAPPAHLASRLLFGAVDRSSSDAAPDESERCALVGGPLSIATIDVHPTSLSIPSRRLSEIIHHQTAGTLYAEGVSDLVRKALPGADVDGAASHLCTWIVETSAAIDKEFERAALEAFSAYAAFVTHGTVGTLRQKLALALVEAVLQRCGALDTLDSYVGRPDGAPHLICNFGCTKDYNGTAAQAALRQRMASIHIASRNARADAWAVVPLLKPLMLLNLYDPVATRSVSPLACELVESLALATMLGSLLTPRHTVLLRSGLYHTLLLPLLTADLLQPVHSLLRLDGGVFMPKELGLVPSLEVPAIDSAIAPDVLHPAVLSLIDDCRWLLRRWVGAVATASRIARSPEFVLRPCDFSDGEGTLRAVSDAVYADARLKELVDLVVAIKADGCGLLPPPLMCQFATIHHAACAFPLLSAHHFRNWELFFDTVMPRTRVLKYTEVDAQRVYAEPVAPVAAPAILTDAHQPSKGSALLPVSVSDPIMAAAVDEERALLRTRVTLLTSELADCRSLLFDMQHRAELAEAAAAAAQQQLEAIRNQWYQQLKRTSDTESALLDPAAPPPPPDPAAPPSDAPPSENKM